MIYKRDPVIHKLPAGWDDMDAVKYLNINTISGLQHINNTMAAEQNSTYDCKNVYQDESGNLTVRPALRHVRSINEPAYIDIISRYDTINGEVIHNFDKRDGYYYINNYRTNSDKIIVTDSKDKTYIFFKDENDKLALATFDGKAVTKTEGVININSPDEPISRLYNLLNNKYYYEAIDKSAPVEKTEFYADILTRETNIPVADVLKVHMLNDNKLLVITKTGYFIYRRYSYNLTLLNSGLFADEENNQQFTITDCYVITNDGSATIYAVYASGTIVHSLHFTIDNNGFIIFEHKQSVDIGAALVDYIALSNGGFAYVTSEKFGVYDYAGNLRYNEDSSDIAYRVNRRQLSCTKNKLLLLTDVGALLPTDRAYVTVTLYNYMDASVVFDSSLLFNHNGIYVKYAGRRLSTNDTAIIYECTIAITVPGETSKLHYLDDDWHTALLPTTKNVYGIFQSNTTLTFYTPAITTNPVQYVFDTKQKRFIAYEHEYDQHNAAYFNILNDGEIILYGENGNININIRNKLPQKVIVERRSTDDIPVVTDIEDDILTGFYLDNIYWFVTKHHVFGTGVADEAFTIEYFDPRKYFHFSEEITGAIRISDTSFWVLHKNGAYLIYKATSEIYDSLSNDYVQTITWLVTNTAKSKGCDFDNAVITLPVSNLVACVTSDDISVIQMRENVQTDDRILVPMTLRIQRFISNLLTETASILTGTFKYNALFFLNPQKESGKVPVIVYNTTADSWWYWELPVNKVQQVIVTENGIEILAKYDTHYSVYDLYTDYYTYTLGGLTWEIYADRLLDYYTPTKIDWFWKSAILHFNTMDYKKQLLFTNFTFNELEAASISFEYNFEVYDKEYSECSWSEINQVIEKTKTYSCKNLIAKFMYLQLYMKSIESEEFEYYTCPKISSIMFKYRILSGGLS